MADYSYGQRLKIVRAHLGLNQTEFAELISTTLPTVRGWENEKRSDPSPAGRTLINMFFGDPKTAKALLDKGITKTRMTDR